MAQKECFRYTLLSLFTSLSLVSIYWVSKYLLDLFEPWSIREGREWLNLAMTKPISFFAVMEWVQNLMEKNHKYNG
jgi:hypothetical protein